MTTATYYICASVCVLVLCAVSYALGWAEGRRAGEIDCYEEAVGECLKEAIAGVLGQCRSRWPCKMCGNDKCKAKRWRKALEGANHKGK